MRISIVTPAGVRSRNGNRTTAARWAHFLRELGHRVAVEQQWSGAPADVMIALHARRSFASISGFADACPGRPLIVALTGTDVYRDIQTDRSAQRSLELATHFIVLQDRAVSELEPTLRKKARVIYQSARRVTPPRALSSCFEVIVSGHLRAEKDPFRTAAALAYLPDASRIRVTHIGRALSAQMSAEAHAWIEREPRYRWIGEVPHWRALRLLARARLLVVSSRMEGGANVVSEALCAGVPVLASRVSGNIGMLGTRYPGYFPLSEERALARLLARAERDESYYRRLSDACAARAQLVSPARERAALDALISEVTAGAAAKARIERAPARAGLSAKSSPGA